jgi:hypothetical protein
MCCRRASSSTQADVSVCAAASLQNWSHLYREANHNMCHAHNMLHTVLNTLDAPCEITMQGFDPATRASVADTQAGTWPLSCPAAASQNPTHISAPLPRTKFVFTCYRACCRATRACSSVQCLQQWWSDVGGAVCMYVCLSMSVPAAWTAAYFCCSVGQFQEQASAAWHQLVDTVQQGLQEQVRTVQQGLQ